MKISIRYLKESDIFEFQAIERKLRSHFLLTRAELNNLRTLLEQALVESKVKKTKGGEGSNAQQQ